MINVSGSTFCIADPTRLSSPQPQCAPFSSFIGHAATANAKIKILLRRVQDLIDTNHPAYKKLILRV
ncbi:hypothetical protein Pdw03_3803 [Penicillium digitatum]|uniref:Uncharacterized protein n=1 Tax=Penicillium digitatum TaxID=36651 RepID=A0A7T6XH02_PENDI|nr:hypothetical protein Pdw03_3803 [Penicillium digitatum]